MNGATPETFTDGMKAAFKKVVAESAGVALEKVTFTFNAQSSSCKSAWVQCLITVKYTVAYGLSEVRATCDA